ncbi:isochorismatase family protein [Micromonospora cremea]|uniref:isochorismatase family protein n=1 Tax=Micromonospora cremea TaxID=709881 RepID=UPI000940C1DC|nr:isochorismatase family protein [Micromonospora cremea]
MLVIDLQVDVVAECVDRDGVLSRTAALIDRARVERVPVVFVQHQDTDLQPGTAGWQLADGIAPAPGEPVVSKEYRDSFAGTGLEGVLAELEVSHLVVGSVSPSGVALGVRVVPDVRTIPGHP